MYDDHVSQIDSINKETEIIKKYQMDILKLKSTKTEMKIHQNSLTIIKTEEERIIELKYKLIDIIQSKEERKKNEKSEYNLRHMKQRKKNSRKKEQCNQKLVL